MTFQTKQDGWLRAAPSEAVRSLRGHHAGLVPGPREPQARPRRAETPPGRAGHVARGASARRADFPGSRPAAAPAPPGTLGRGLRPSPLFQELVLFSVVAEWISPPLSPANRRPPRCAVLQHFQEENKIKTIMKPRNVLFSIALGGIARQRLGGVFISLPRLGTRNSGPPALLARASGAALGRPACPARAVLTGFLLSPAEHPVTHQSLLAPATVTISPLRLLPFPRWLRGEAGAFPAQVPRCGELGPGARGLLAGRGKAAARGEGPAVTRWEGSFPVPYRPGPGAVAGGGPLFPGLLPIQRRPEPTLWVPRERLYRAPSPPPPKLGVSEPPHPFQRSRPGGGRVQSRGPASPAPRPSLPSQASSFAEPASTLLSRAYAELPPGGSEEESRGTPARLSQPRPGPAPRSGPSQPRRLQEALGSPEFRSSPVF